MNLVGVDLLLRGGVGRIHADYLTSITGTTGPTIDSRQDTSLIIPSASEFFTLF
jgi:hypothetical protein